MANVDGEPKPVTWKDEAKAMAVEAYDIKGPEFVTDPASWGSEHWQEIAMKWCDKRAERRNAGPVVIDPLDDASKRLAVANAEAEGLRKCDAHIARILSTPFCGWCLKRHPEAAWCSRKWWKPTQ